MTWCRGRRLCMLGPPPSVHSRTYHLHVTVTAARPKLHYGGALPRAILSVTPVVFTSRPEILCDQRISNAIHLQRRQKAQVSALTDLLPQAMRRKPLAYSRTSLSGRQNILLARVQVAGTVMGLEVPKVAAGVPPSTTAWHEHRRDWQQRLPCLPRLGLQLGPWSLDNAPSLPSHRARQKSPASHRNPRRLRCWWHARIAVRLSHRCGAEMKAAILSATPAVFTTNSTDLIVRCR